MNVEHTIVSDSAFPGNGSCQSQEKDICCPEGSGWLRMPRQDILCLCRQIAVLWDFIAESGLWGDAKDYLEDHLDEGFPIPFSFLR